MKQDDGTPNFVDDLWLILKRKCIRKDRHLLVSKDHVKNAVKQLWFRYPLRPRYMPKLPWTKKIK